MYIDFFKLKSVHIYIVLTYLEIILAMQYSNIVVFYQRMKTSLRSLFDIKYVYIVINYNC